jgi:glycosyltransferase involved in cell wall biosynthesis
MHILYLHQYFCPPGGAGNNRSMDLARAWVRAGHQVTMLTTTAYFPASMHFQERKKEFDVDGIQVEALNIPYSHMMGFGARVWAWLRFYRLGMRVMRDLKNLPDLIYASSTPPTVGEMGRKMAQRLGIPFVFETVDVWPDVPIGMGILRNGWQARWITRRVNRIYAEARLIVALSDGMKEQIQSHGVPAEKVMVSYNGTRLDAFPYLERPAREGLHIIYTGTVGKANGVGVLADLSRLLVQRGIQGVRFTVLGGGNDLANVKARVKELGVQNIEFISTVSKEEVGNWLAKADVGVVTFAPFPVLEANSANKFYDYVASGLPVLINYEGWQAEYLKEIGCGLSSGMGNLEGLADNVERLLNEPDLRIQMGRNGRRLAEEKFDRERLANELLSAFERCVVISPQTPSFQ